MSSLLKWKRDALFGALFICFANGASSSSACSSMRCNPGLRIISCVKELKSTPGTSTLWDFSMEGLEFGVQSPCPDFCKKYNFPAFLCKMLDVLEVVQVRNHNWHDSILASHLPPKKPEEAFTRSHAMLHVVCFACAGSMAFGTRSAVSAWSFWCPECCPGLS